MPENRVSNQGHSASGGVWIAWALGGAAVLVPMLTNGRYGYFRDELYYLAARDHLAWGYVDFAPQNIHG
ncbi:MAG: hypothetical protein WB795_13545 [Candidatus Acidiferrales bacterium]